MKILFVCDLRSPIAVNWIRQFSDNGFEVVVISSFPTDELRLKGVKVYVVPVALNSLKSNVKSISLAAAPTSPIPRLANSFRVGRLAKIAYRCYSLLAPLTLRAASRRIERIVSEERPDLVHALRIPLEGVVSAQAVPAHLPLIISVWGNDFQLFAKQNPLSARATHRAMSRADALHADCDRDRKLAIQWSFDPEKPSIVLPGAGGIRTELFHPGKLSSRLADSLSLRPEDYVVINPRGFRNYVRTDTFFKSIPHVIGRVPNVVFLCPAMDANPEALRWVEELGIERHVRLLPFMAQSELSDLYRAADISVSPSEYDGTPNTLLESISCGCFPIAGDIESVREWIQNGENGLLVNPGDHQALADAIVRAIESPGMRESAQRSNEIIVQERADRSEVSQQAKDFYELVVEKKARGR